MNRISTTTITTITTITITTGNGAG
ncbi:thr operon leader peptide [Salmonella enterica]|uniref:thr operon leader peptide n=2 Tax=Salmonella enterica TaxID=28901 RepID=A0A723SMR0_SALTM|nr:thr operon leader peptide [Salmonella enterica]EAW1757009.1 thr operon leader peptide [Salmonella enterica subsp. enterica]EBK1962440.1 thr operon leader peptide [Salmonella enterica subsp. enterica serovar Agona]EBL3442162.1 thr operon leader peptide [Salmonella enterica subsp. enterica serovar Typhimurium]EBQ8816776.1 thr operon leader peptide [Salmonella enterica subsp. enterica serovar Kisarawe]ECC3676401.1 thr operon leader peptide [Salmonella enterica subsp. enterica serovar Miami]EC